MEVTKGKATIGTIPVKCKNCPEILMRTYKRDDAICYDCKMNYKNEIAKKYRMNK